LPQDHHHFFLMDNTHHVGWEQTWRRWTRTLCTIRLDSLGILEAHGDWELARPSLEPAADWLRSRRKVSTAWGRLRCYWVLGCYSLQYSVCVYEQLTSCLIYLAPDWRSTIYHHLLVTPRLASNLCFFWPCLTTAGITSVNHQAQHPFVCSFLFYYAILHVLTFTSGQTELRI
jgi:hypothetical protein